MDSRQCHGVSFFRVFVRRYCRKQIVNAFFHGNKVNEIMIQGKKLYIYACMHIYRERERERERDRESWCHSYQVSLSSQAMRSKLFQKKLAAHYTARLTAGRGRKHPVTKSQDQRLVPGVRMVGRLCRAHHRSNLAF